MRQIDSYVRTRRSSRAALARRWEHHGSMIDFGRYSGWTIGQIKRADPEFLEWFMHVHAGRRYKDEIGALLGRKSN